MTTVRGLTVTTADVNTLTLCRENPDQRERAFSVTIEGPDSSWGEFLSPSDLALIAAWAHAALEEWLQRPLEVSDA